MFPSVCLRGIPLVQPPTAGEGAGVGVFVVVLFVATVFTATVVSESSGTDFSVVVVVVRLDCFKNLAPIDVPSAAQC